MRASLIAAFLLIASGAAVKAHSAATGIVASHGAYWVKTFDDEFDGKGLDTKKWTADTGHQPNRSHPIDYHLPSQVSVSGGVLHLRSRYRLFKDRNYVSGQITTRHKFEQRYGLYVVRCRFPSGRGVWPAVFLLPASGGWPPEIDITEFIGKNPHTVYLTNHWGADLKSHRQSNSNDKDLRENWFEWHKYAVEWEPGKVRWYIDGRLVGSTPSTATVSSQPMFIVANLDIGGSFAGPPDPDHRPQTFDIDYIRVYRKSARPQPKNG